MKKIILISFFVGLFNSSLASAAVTLTQSKLSEYNDDIKAEATSNGLSRVELDKRQTFDVIKDGKTLGTLIQGKGWVREVQPVCFIGWSKDGEKINHFIQTIGQGDWETVGCHKVSSVGIISKNDDPDTKIAVIYRVEIMGGYSDAYYIFGLKNSNGSIYYDADVSARFENAYLKTIANLRKAYQK